MSTLIVQNDHVTRLTIPAAKSARDLGIQIIDLPFNFDRAPKLYETPMILGSLAFAEKLRVDFPKAVFWSSHAFNADTWKDAIGDDFLNFDGRVMTVESFCRAGYRDPQHIRSMDGRKLIGRVPPSFDSAGRRPMNLALQTSKSLQSLDLDPGAFIWVSPMKGIMEEVRFWMIDRNPVACAIYRYKNTPVVSPRNLVPLPEAWRFATLLAREWLPEANVVMDLALTTQGWSVIEFNPIHSSGWYGVDIDIVLDAYRKSSALQS